VVPEIESGVMERFMKALTVDDSTVIRKMVSKVLSGAGFEVAEAGNGEEALLYLLQTGAPDLVVLDWNMPHMGGLEFLGRMRSLDRFRNIKVIMLTARNEMAAVQQAMHAGANEYLMKPFVPELLIDKIRLVGLDVKDLDVE
jgi:two-component system, chemotaxis family, chemotaxis protein CheY